jgi:hypothetical protein
VSEVQHGDSYIDIDLVYRLIAALVCSSARLYDAQARAKELKVRRVVAVRIAAVPLVAMHVDAVRAIF